VLDDIHTTFSLRVINTTIWNPLIFKKNTLLLIDMIYLTAIGLSPGGSTHLHTNNTQNNTNNRTTQITTNVEECGPCPVFARFTLAFALQLRGGKTRENVSRGKKTLSQVKENLSQSTVYILHVHGSVHHHS
jgi:hypothetical protein